MAINAGVRTAAAMGWVDDKLHAASLIRELSRTGDDSNASDDEDDLILADGSGDALIIGKKTRLFAPFVLLKMMIILPRQARDKHNIGKTLKRRRFFCRR
eukprot:COSAG06_NODE_2456_length_6848_cov_66.970959_7_plen_100_part_00